MTSLLLIGLTGAAGAGKDEAAKVLARAGWRGMAFADALRIEVAQAWAIDIGLFVDRTSKEKPTPQLSAGWCGNAEFLRWAAYQGHSLHSPRSPRWVMQQWGSFRRNANPRHWVNYVEQWVAFQASSGQPRGLVISDVRQPNEADMVHGRGGYLVRVHRPDLPPLEPSTAGHESELHSQLQADIDLHNDGDLQHLQAEVWRVVQHLHDNPRQPQPTNPTATGEATHG